MRSTNHHPGLDDPSFGNHLPHDDEWADILIDANHAVDNRHAPKEPDVNRDAIQRQIRALSLELARIEAQPNDDFDNGAVITFVKTFSAQDEYTRRTRGGAHGPFTYAAVKAGGKWYVTGGSGPQRATWTTLWDFIGKDELDAPVVHFVSEWTELA